jgi:predicted DNA-binding ribbon-helix-helix protein
MTHQSKPLVYTNPSQRFSPPSHNRSVALDMKSSIIKRSIELRGHKTSVSLEDEFWTSLRAVANAQGVSLPTLLLGIDDARDGANLSSAIRVHVLNFYRNRVTAAETDHGSHAPAPLPPSA